MASSQATRPRLSSTGAQRGASRRTSLCQSSTRASPGPTLTQSSLASVPKIPTPPPKLPRIRTKSPQNPPSATSSSPIQEHSPCSSFSVSPSALSSMTSPFSPIPRGAAHLVSRSQDGARGGKVFRPPRVAGKGSHRRAEQPPRPQPQPPVFREFRLESEVRGAKSRAEFVAHCEEEEEKRKQARQFKAKPLSASLHRGPPVVLDRSSTLRRASHRRRQQ